MLCCVAEPGLKHEAHDLYYSFKFYASRNQFEVELSVYVNKHNTCLLGTRAQILLHGEVAALVTHYYTFVYNITIYTFHPTSSHLCSV